MNERIKKLRKALDLTQQAFADRLGIKQNTIAKYETNRGTPTTSVVSLIVREFNVNETWLRTGEGEMFVELPQNEALAALIQAFLQGGTDSFRGRLVSLLLRLAPEQWDTLEEYLMELMKDRPALETGKGIHTPAIVDDAEIETSTPDTSEKQQADYEAEARAEAELFYQQRLSEKKQESQVSSAKESGAS